MYMLINCFNFNKPPAIMTSSVHVLGVIALVFLNSSFCFLIPDGIQKVNTSYGDIIGFTDQVTFDSQTYQVRKFLGIPYAEPPVGNLRFKKPVMKRSLPSPFKADKYGPICPQVDLNNLSLPMSENCLFLNIFTPAESSTSLKSKPVMIWVHGGGFFIGASNGYNSDVISAYNDVIVVTLNYRLGALGFFSTHDENAKGNYGLWDQHLAFRWVYDNIGAFGGDNANITIFGESAGSSAVVYQMLYPGNEGIFKRVIAESGTLASWGVGNGDGNYKSSMEFGKLVGCNDTSHVELVACLQQQSQADISAAALKVGLYFNEVNMSWVPVYDGDFVPAKTNQILNELVDNDLYAKYTSFRSFDLMIGANNFDGLVLFAMLLSYFKQNPTNPNYDVFSEHLTDVVIPRALEARFGEMPTKLAKELTEGEYMYIDWSDPTNTTKKLFSAVNIFTDYGLTAPTIRTAKAHTNTQSSTYVYQFTNAAPFPAVATPPVMMNHYVANHADEVQFVFGFGQYKLPTQPSPQDINLSKAVMTLWTNFAKTGNPNHPIKLQPLYDVTWPEYDTTGENYLEINDRMSPSSVKQRLAARAVEFWNNILPKVQAFAKSQAN